MNIAYSNIELDCSLCNKRTEKAIQVTLTEEECNVIPLCEDCLPVLKRQIFSLNVDK